MYTVPDRRRRGRSEKGQTTVEYAVIVAVLAIAAIVALVFLRDTVRGTFSDATPSPPTQTFRPPVACDAHYSGGCIPAPPPDLDCDDLARMGIAGTVSVAGSDPHHLDDDGDGIACN
jgi:Flp pilus assembly pilin Flp